MTGIGLCGGYWWIFPLVMIAICVFFMMRGCNKMMCGFGNFYDSERSALEILNKRYARGDIDQKEYEEKKRKLT